MEYASPEWNPFHKKEINRIESVQKFALRMCLKSWKLDYEELLENAHIPTLRSRHNRAGMCHLSKIVRKQTHFPNAPTVSRQNPYNTRALNQNTLVVPKANTTSYQSSFFPRTLALWNNSEDITLEVVPINLNT